MKMTYHRQTANQVIALKFDKISTSSRIKENHGRQQRGDRHRPCFFAGFDISSLSSYKVSLVFYQSTPLRFHRDWRIIPADSNESQSPHNGERQGNRPSHEERKGRTGSADAARHRLLERRWGCGSAWMKAAANNGKSSNKL
ncbi:hypothetical protein [Burkholderia sp. 22PA0106]|uniref:hypothetical protein n=1 Tax=Burkholderia sp. 22PA0106 TaxID=3237371 RepID=UPI0039C1AEBC